MKHEQIAVSLFLVISLMCLPVCARPSTTHASARTEAAGLDSARADSLDALGMLRFALGEYAGADTLLSLALDLRQGAFGPRHPDVGVSLGNLGRLRVRQSRLEEARNLCAQALEIAEDSPAPDSSNIALALTGLGALCLAEANCRAAESYYERALSTCLQAPGHTHRDIAECLKGLGSTCNMQSRYAEAEQLFRQSLSIEQQIYAEGDARMAASVTGLAHSYLGLGRNSEAGELLGQAIEAIAASGGALHPDLASPLVFLGSLENSRGHVMEAEGLFARALTSTEAAFGIEHIDAARALAYSGRLFYRLGRREEAEAACERALEVMNGMGLERHPISVGCLKVLADIKFDQGRYPEADSLYLEVLAADGNQICQNPIARAGHMESISRRYGAIGRFEAAMEFAWGAFELQERHFYEQSVLMAEEDALTYSSTVRGAADTFLSAYFQLPLKSDTLTMTAADVILATKGCTSEISLVRSSASRNAGATSVYSDSLIATQKRMSDLYVMSLFGPSPELDTLLYATLQRKRALESEVAWAHRDLVINPWEVGSVDLKKIREALSRSTEKVTVVEYLKYNRLVHPNGFYQHYLALLISSDGQVAVIDLGEAQDIDKLVNAYSRHMAALASSRTWPGDKDMLEYRRISEHLYRRVLYPLEPVIGGSDLLLIAPDASLGLVSFASLVDGRGRFMIEILPVHYLSAARDLIRLGDGTAIGTGLVAFGSPDYDYRNEPPGSAPADAWSVREIAVSPLPGSGVEIEVVASEWQSSTEESVFIFQGAEASEMTFKSIAPGKRVLHLATHAYFFGSRPAPENSPGYTPASTEFRGAMSPLLLSGLFLAGANNPPSNRDFDDRDDGIVTAEEVATMNLEGVQLVVLSACESGVGQAISGEGVYGLSRAFRLAGARTFVGSLWPVRDEMAPETMAALYAGKDTSLPEAMRRMQLEMIRKIRASGRPAHPFTWAMFVATGDWE